MTDSDILLAVFLWLWVVGSLGAFLFQFIDMIVPVLRLLGLG